MKFRVILCDPPYRFNNKNTGGSMKSGSKDKYPTMSLDSLMLLPIKDITSPKAWLFLWCPASMFLDGIGLMHQWGFDYKTVAFVWVKKCRVSTEKNFWGMGFSTRQGAELCLLGTKGKPVRASARVHQIIEAPVGEHSAKPIETYQRIEKLCGKYGHRIELFARLKKKGWYCHGNEIRGADLKFRRHVKKLYKRYKRRRIPYSQMVVYTPEFKNA